MKIPTRINISNDKNGNATTLCVVYFSMKADDFQASYRTKPPISAWNTWNMFYVTIAQNNLTLIS